MINFKIAIIGECMVELQRNDGSSLKESFGGDTLNTALYLSRLSNHRDIQVSYVSALGDDPFSKKMLSAWKAEGIDTSLVINIAGKMPGLYSIETDNVGERHFYYWRSDSAAKYMFDLPESHRLLSTLLQYDAIYLSGVTLAILTDNGKEKLFDLLQEFKSKGGKIFFDNNYRPTLWPDKSSAIRAYKTVLKLTHTALLTFEDEQELYGDACLEQCVERTSRAGVQEIVIKRGSKDCLVIQVGKDAKYVPAIPVPKRVDTTAAGDSFSAGYLAKRFTNGNAIQATEMGHRLASIVIQHQGAVIPKNLTPSIN